MFWREIEKMPSSLVLPSEWMSNHAWNMSLLLNVSPSLRHRPRFVSSPGVWDSYSPGCFGPSSSLLLPRMRSFLPLGTPIMKPNFVEPSLALGWLHSFLIVESDPRWPKFAYYWFWDSLIQFHTLCSTQSLDFTQWNDHGKDPQALSERRWSAFQGSDMRGTWTFRPAQHIGRWPPAFKLPFKTLRVPGGWRLTGPESVTFYRNIKKKKQKKWWVDGWSLQPVDGRVSALKLLPFAGAQCFY